MLLNIDSDHKQHVRTLSESSIDVVCELCRLAMGSLETGRDDRREQSISKKLGLESGVVKETIGGLIYLFSEAAKHNLKELDFYDSLLAMGLAEDVCKALTEHYVSHLVMIRNVLRLMAPALPQYHNLQWRFDVQVASRSLHHQVEPQVLLKFHTKDGDKDLTALLQTDPTNLVHLTQSLEQALAESKTVHSRRIMRNL